MLISIHALVKRATNRQGAGRDKSFHFNPRPRKEGDHNISRCASSKIDFNPRPRKEGDVIAWVEIDAKVEFQSTPS